MQFHDAHGNPESLKVNINTLAVDSVPASQNLQLKNGPISLFRVSTRTSSWPLGKDLNETRIYDHLQSTGTVRQGGGFILTQI